MAIYHLSVKVIGRNSGRSSVGAAAYRAGDMLTNEYDGITHDYTNKKGVEYSEIMLPDNAPKEYYNRSTLWNAVENIEKTKDAQLAREIEVALPIELDLEQQKELVRNYIKENFVDDGMCVDFSIHNPVSEERGIKFLKNPHAHIMMTMRPLDKNGNWQKKALIEYVCTRSGSGERKFTAEEFKLASKEGWQKQYKFKDGNKKIWLTMKEGAKQNLERIDRNPKTSKYGRQNPVIKRWNDVESELLWRKNWEVAINSTMENFGFDARVDCRSFKEQGRIDEIPSIHIGPVGTAIEKREKNTNKCVDHIPHSDRVMINREIQDYNKLLYNTNIELKNIKTRMDELSATTLYKVDNLKSELQKCIENRNKILYGSRQSAYELEKLKNTIIQLNESVDKISRANDKSAMHIASLHKERDKLNIFESKKKADISNKILVETEAIKNRNVYLESVFNEFNIVDINGLKTLVNQYSEAEEEQKKQINLVMSLINDIKDIAGELLQCFYIMGDNISGDYNVSALGAELHRNNIELAEKDIDFINKKYETNYSTKDINKNAINDRSIANGRAR